jgi:hypothetical protein
MLVSVLKTRLSVQVIAALRYVSQSKELSLFSVTASLSFRFLELPCFCIAGLPSRRAAAMHRVDALQCVDELGFYRVFE